MQPNLKKLTRHVTAEEYAARRKQREQSGFAEDAAARILPVGAADSNRLRKRRSITATNFTMQLAKKCGYGNASWGIERALHLWNESRGIKKSKPRTRSGVDVRHMKNGPKMRKLIKTGYFKKFHGKLQGR